MDLASTAYVEITEQPMGKGLRFRYISEGRTAGSILGERSVNEHRTYPSIKVHNYAGPAVAVVSCVTVDRPAARPHPHHLVGTNCTSGICRTPINVSSEPIPFAGIGIQCCTRKDVVRNLEERRLLSVDPFGTGFQVNADTIDLTTICLCFQVFANLGGQMIPLTPVVSNPIVDKKVCSELSICRLSRISGSVRGGDEVFLLCSKVKKEDIKVVLSHRLEGGELWEKEGSFSSTDVHKQYVIVFKTPPFCMTDIRKPVDVSLYLMRPSDNAVGESKTFTYFPENPDPFGIQAKRKRLAENNMSSYLTSSFELPSGLASVTNSHSGQNPRFGFPAPRFSNWNFSANSMPTIPEINPKIKPENPTATRAGLNIIPGIPRFSNFMGNTGVPTSVEGDSIGFGNKASLFPWDTSSSSASALELIYKESRSQVVMPPFNTSSMIQLETPPKAPFSGSTNSGTGGASHTTQSANDLLVGAVASSALPGLDLTSNDFDSLSQQLPDDVLNDILKIMSPDDQRFLINGSSGILDLTEEQLNFGDFDFLQ